MPYERRGPSRVHVVLVMLGFIVWSLPIVMHQAAAEEPATSPLFDAWIQGKRLKMGYNPKAQVFVAKGAGRNRLECLVSAIGDFSQWLGAEVKATEFLDGDKPAANLVSVSSEHVIHGYDIQHALMLQQETEHIESLTSVKTRDGMLCALYTNSAEPQNSIAFFPSLDESRRDAIEKELSARFVVDSMAHRPADEVIACVFVFKCGRVEQPADGQRR